MAGGHGSGPLGQLEVGVGPGVQGILLKHGLERGRGLGQLAQAQVAQAHKVAAVQNVEPAQVVVNNAQVGPRHGEVVGLHLVGEVLLAVAQRPGENSVRLRLLAQPRPGLALVNPKLR